MRAIAQQMDWQTAIYRVGSYLRHSLTARHTGGHGIHSPYLFEWVRMVMSDENSYYAWREIEKVRANMLADTREVEFEDYGSRAARSLEDGSGTAYSLENGSGAAYCLENGSGAAYGLVFRERRRVCDIAKRSLAKKKYAQMLARLVNWLDDGLTIVELGTSLGVTTAYMAAMDSRNKVVTYEGCSGVATIAEENWKSLGIRNIECRVGEITADVLERDLDKVDVAFIDANHTYTSTLAYFNVLAKKVHAKSVIVVDDIHYNPEMERAWKEICADERVTSTMDLYQMGLVFFDQHYWKRHYGIRV